MLLLLQEGGLLLLLHGGVECLTPLLLLLHLHVVLHLELVPGTSLHPCLLMVMLLGASRLLLMMHLVRRSGGGGTADLAPPADLAVVALHATFAAALFVTSSLVNLLVFVALVIVLGCQQIRVEVLKVAGGVALASRVAMSAGSSCLLSFRLRGRLTICLLLCSSCQGLLLLLLLPGRVDGACTLEGLIIENGGSATVAQEFRHVSV